jgi:hypothetical protein
MSRAPHRLAGLLGLGLFACSSVTPSSPSEIERDGIVGGENDTTDRGVFGILIKNQALCSGTLIAPNLVLTARHCVADLSTGDNPIDCTKSTFSAPYSASSFLLSWASDLTGNVPRGDVFRASDVRVPTPTQFCGNDVALLILSSDVPSSTATPIAPRVDTPPATNEPFTAIGYGLTDPTDTQGTTAGVRHDLGGLQVGCVGAVECFGTRAKDDEWAANASICHGDSGGPALDAEGRVIGVASRADQTCSTGLYSSVSAWKSLIVSTATDAANAGGYTPPAWTTGGGGSGGMSSTNGSAGATPLLDGGVTPPSPDAGPSSDGDGGLVKTGPELGETCNDGCFGDLLCYASDGKPPGVCVPPCGASDKSCPSDYLCNVNLGACVPKTSTKSSTTASASCGCRIGGDATTTAWPALGIFAACGGMLRRRRRA